MLSVIIPTCNRNALLSKCLDKLAPAVQSIYEGIYEVIVTDDSKESIAKQLIQENYHWVKWIKGPAKGPAANRNNGAKHAKGDWLVFIDDDCIPDRKLLYQYLNGIKNNPVCLAFEGAILPDNAALLKKDMAECPINIEGGCFWSANICINSRLFNDIGGFDERYLIAAQEDQDIYLKILDKTEVFFLKNCFVVHPVRIRRLAEKLSRIPKELLNWIFFAKKNNSWIQLIAIGYKFHINGCIKTIRTCKIQMTLYHLSNLIYLIPGVINYVLYRKKKII